MIVFDASTLILIAKAELLDLFLADIELEAAIPIEVEKGNSLSNCKEISA